MPVQSSPLAKRERAGARRRAREFCVALLYAADAGGHGPRVLEQADEILSCLLEIWNLAPLEARKLGPSVSRFGRLLCEQYFAHAAEIDERIGALSQGWPLERMPIVDRNILRMALAELLHLADIPVGASIDEAVDLAKEYGTAESGRFVNGILGTVARGLQESAPTAREAGSPG